MKYFLCTEQSLRPITLNEVIWLDHDKDYELAKIYWAKHGLELPYSMWLEAQESGYEYAAIIKNGAIVSCAAVWRFSDVAWEVSAVTTLEAHRQQGNSRKVVSFITRFILSEGRTPTTSTQDDNLAMIAKAKSVGFQEVAPEKVWWLEEMLK